jgi:hypothetical protein
MSILNLKEVQVGTKTHAQLVEMMSNLPKLNAALTEPGLVDVEYLRKAIKVELATKRRPATLARLMGRIKTLIGQEIDQEVYGA